MAERASVFNHVQLGLEVTPGTAVATAVQLQDTGFTLRPRIPSTEYSPMGSKSATELLLQKEHAEGTFEGTMAYMDIAYILQSCLTKATALVGTNTWKPSNFNPDDPQTYTIEFGSSAGAERVAYGLINGLDLRFTQTEATCRGEVIGRTMADGITMAASPTIIPSVPIHPKDVGIWLGDTIGGLTSVGRALEATWSLGQRYSMVKTLDPATPSFSAIVERKLRNTASLTVEADSAAASMMTDLRNSAKKYMRIKATGPIVTGATHYDFQLTFPFKFREPNRADRQDIYVATFDLQPIYDPTLGSYCEFVVVNG